MALPVRLIRSLCLLVLATCTLWVGIPAGRAQEPSQRSESAAPDRATLPVADPDPAQSGYGRTVQFAGHDWRVKTALELVGPGPNYYSDSPDYVWVDDVGRLHLKTMPGADGRWYCAELSSIQSFGYGTYQWVVDGQVDALDPNVVVGFFTWSDDPDQNHREIDVELARFGRPDAPGARYTVQPYTAPGHVWTFQPTHASFTSHAFQWGPSSVAFRTWLGSATAPPSDSSVLAERIFTDHIPQAGGEQARINLWLDAGHPPTNGRPVEIVVRAFQFWPPA